MDPMRLHNEATDIARRCASATGARRFSKHGEEIALITMMLLKDPPQDNIQQMVKREFLRRNPTVGNPFVIFVLPLLVSLISHWIIKWISRRQDLSKLRVAAYEALSD